MPQVCSTGIPMAIQKLCCDGSVLGLGAAWPSSCFPDRLLAFNPQQCLHAAVWPSPRLRHCCLDTTWAHQCFLKHVNSTMEEGFSIFQPQLYLGRFQETQQNSDPQIYCFQAAKVCGTQQIHWSFSKCYKKSSKFVGHFKDIFCNHRHPSQQDQPRFTMALGYIWNTNKQAGISPTPSLKRMFLEVFQSLWDILKQTFTPGREEKESQVTEIINFLGSYQRPRLAKLFPASWCIKLWGCTETVVQALQHCVWQGQSSTPKGLVSRRCWSLWHLLRELVLRQHSLLENRKEITTDEKSKCFEHPWTLFRGKETVIYRLTGRNKAIHWGFCQYSSKILAF